MRDKKYIGTQKCIQFKENQDIIPTRIFSFCSYPFSVYIPNQCGGKS